MAHDTSHPADKLILVIDDEPDVLRYQAAILEDAGFDVVSASDADTALALVRERPPDLISLDLVMPGKSGLRFLHSLRRNRKWATIPVLIVTGHAHDNLGRRDLDAIREEGIVSGPQVCLEKPVRPENYVAAAKERLGMAGLDVPSRSPAPTSRRDEIAALLDGSDRETEEMVLRLLRERTDTSSPAAPREASGPRALVIDDQVDSAAYLAAILEDGGYATTCVTDAREALETARRVRPALITLDVDMPGRSGPEVFDDLQEAEDLRYIPVIVVTGVEKDMRPRFRTEPGRPDIAGYIEKPAPPALLIDTAAKALGRKREEKPVMTSETQKTILIVDDEEDVRSFLAQLLRDNDYATRVASDGEEALRMVQEAKPDLVTLDLQMPNETGTQFYRRLRKEPDFENIPVIVISGVAGRHLAVGQPVAVFDKPIDREGLLEAIREVLG